MAIVYNRGRLTQFVDRHGLTWELTMGLLSSAYLVLAIRSDEQAQGWAPHFALAFTVLFFAEFAARCVDAPQRLRYVRGHWLDVVSCLPWIGGIRVLRLLRLLRLIRMGSSVRTTVAAGQLQRDDAQDGIWVILPIFILAWVGGAVGIWMVEQGVNPDIHNFGDALYFSFITATTVGYGDIHPVTHAGKLLTGILVLTSIGLVGLLSSKLTSLWLVHQEDPVARDVALLHARLDGIEALLRSVAGTGEGSTQK